jgi:integrase
VLGREEIARLLDACLPAYRALIATALYTGMRMSELLGLIWDDVDLAGGAVHVRAQLSRRTRELPRGESRRRRRRPCARSRSPRNSQRSCASTVPRRCGEPVRLGVATRKGTPLGQRNVQRSALTRAARIAGLDREGSSLRFHDLRFTFASHLIVDLQLDVVQVSRILGHASVSTNRLRAGGLRWS